MPAFFPALRDPGSRLAPLPVPVVLRREPAPEPASTARFQNPLTSTTCFGNSLPAELACFQPLRRLQGRLILVLS